MTLANSAYWNDCLSYLEGELSTDHFNTWIRPLQADQDRDRLYLLAPNRFVRDWVEDNYLERIVDIIGKIGNEAEDCQVILTIGSKPNAEQAIDRQEKKA